MPAHECSGDDCLWPEAQALADAMADHLDGRGLTIGEVIFIAEGAAAIVIAQAHARVARDHAEVIPDAELAGYAADYEIGLLQILEANMPPVIGADTRRRLAALERRRAREMGEPIEGGDA